MAVDDLLEDLVDGRRLDLDQIRGRVAGRHVQLESSVAADGLDPERRRSGAQGDRGFSELVAILEAAQVLTQPCDVLRVRLPGVDPRIGVSGQEVERADPDVRAEIDGDPEISSRSIVLPTEPSLTVSMSSRE